MNVTLHELTKRFGATVAVDHFSVTLYDGALISLLGPSGCGKSTLLHMLAGIQPVTEGRIEFDGQDVTQLAPEKRGIGLVFQNYSLYPHMTVRQNIAFPLEIQKVPKSERMTRVEEIAALVHVDGLLDRRPGQLSGGQQQRVAIARALVKRPKLLLLDEPLSNLDARLRLEMREEIRRIQRETGVTTIFVTHDQEEAMAISDHILLMKAGQMMQYDRPQTLYDAPANRFVAQFLGNPPINDWEGTLREGVFTLADGSAAMRCPAFRTLDFPSPVALGIRAESLDLDSAGDMTCTVDTLYRLGKDDIALLRFGSATLRADLPAEHPLRAGDVVRMRLRSRGVFLFDAETGRRIP